MLLQLQNESLLPIKFWVCLESLSKKKIETYQQLPKFLTSHEQRTEIVGELTNTLPGAIEVQLHEEIRAGKGGWCWVQWGQADGGEAGREGR